MCFLGGGVAARRDWELFEIPMGWEIQFQNSSSQGLFEKSWNFCCINPAKERGNTGERICSKMKYRLGSDIWKPKQY